MNPCGCRDPHFETILVEYTSLLVKRSTDWSLLQGHLMITPTVGLSKVLSYRDATLTWTVQRELDAKVIKGVKSHKNAVAFIFSSA
jgi:hypothetical protein